jgi:DNA-binding NarL/FixJ family response regulator
MDDIVRLLLVDANKEGVAHVRQLIYEAAPAQFDITDVPTREAAQRCVRGAEEPYHAALVAVALPDASGLDLMTLFESLTPSPAVILLTGEEDEELATRALRSGAQDYFLRTRMNGPAIVRSIRFAIERQRVRQYAGASEEEEVLSDVAQLVTVQIGQYASDLQRQTEELLRMNGKNTAVAEELNAIHDTALRIRNLLKTLGLEPGSDSP